MENRRKEFTHLKKEEKNLLSKNHCLSMKEKNKLRKAHNISIPSLKMYYQSLKFTLTTVTVLDIQLFEHHLTHQQRDKEQNITESSKNN